MKRIQFSRRYLLIGRYKDRNHNVYYWYLPGMRFQVGEYD